jgi:DHA2 family multidrug resistance protein
MPVAEYASEVEELEELESSPVEMAAELGNASSLPEAAAPPKAFNPWIVAIVVTIGTFMEVLDTSIANVALPHIAGGLSASLDEGAWVLTSYLVANAVVLPISGWLSSIMGRKNYYLLSVFLFTVFSAACGFAPSLGVLVAFRVLQGLAGGGLQPSVQAILADSFSNKQRGMAMALYTVAILVAPVLGPTAGGWITDNYSWRWIFYINIPIGIVCVFLTRIVLQDPPHMVEAKARARKLSVDWTGLGLIALGLATLEIVLDKGQELDWFGSSFITVIAAVSAISLVGAIFWELHCDNPVVNLRLLKERNFHTCCIIILALYAALYAATYLLPVYMQQMMGYDATTAGFALSPAGIFTIMEVPIVGYLLTKGFDPRKMAFWGLIVISISFWWMAHLNLDVSEGEIILPRILQVLGVGIITVPISTVIFRFLPKDQSSQAAGIYALMRNEGGSLGIALVSTMLQRKTQLHQQMLGQHMEAANGFVQQSIAGLAAAPGNLADHHYSAMAQLYNAMLRQATMLSYMDQFRLLGGITLCMLPLIFLLKRPPVQKHIELDAH